MLWHGGNRLLRQAFPTHIARDRQTERHTHTHTQNTLKFYITSVELLVAGLTHAYCKLALHL